MSQRRRVLCLAAGVAVTPAFAALPALPAEAAEAGKGAYFPPLGSREWAPSDPAAAGWDSTALEALFDYGQAQGSTGIVIVQNGRIVAERYWPLTAAQRRASGQFAALHHGETPEGWPIEDVASVQKSVVSVLVGIARSKGLVDIDKSAASYIGAGWSKAPRDKEAAITVRHLLSMASGLDEGLRYEAPAGSRWLYNTPAYGQLLQVLERASGRTIDDITRAWLSAPLGMADSRWGLRQGRRVASNAHGFVTTPRDLARLGLALLHGGIWDGRDVLAGQSWLAESLAPSQSSYPGYGHLWWLNRGAPATGSHAAQPPLAGWFVPAAPADMIAARGHFNRRLYIVPSLSLVVVRLGAQAQARRFDQEFWPYLMRALPKQ